MSTSRSRTGSPTSKKLSSCVRPGVFEVRARLLRLVSRLSSEDLPTLERPAKAISGTPGSGRNLSSGADFRNETGPEKSFRAASSSSASRRSLRARPLRRVGGAGRRRAVAAGPRQRLLQRRVAAVEPFLLGDGEDVVGHPVELQAGREGAITNISTHGISAKICRCTGSGICGLSRICSHIVTPSRIGSTPIARMRRRREGQIAEQVDRGQRIGRGQVAGSTARTACGASRPRPSAPCRARRRSGSAAGSAGSPRPGSPSPPGRASSSPPAASAGRRRSAPGAPSSWAGRPASSPSRRTASGRSGRAAARTMRVRQMIATPKLPIWANSQFSSEKIGFMNQSNQPQSIACSSGGAELRPNSVRAAATSLAPANRCET